MIKIGNSKILSVDFHKVISKIRVPLYAKFKGRMLIFCELHGKRIYVNFIFIDPREIIESGMSYFLVRDKYDTIVYSGRKLDNFNFLCPRLESVYKFEFYDKYGSWLFSRYSRVFEVYDIDNISNYILDGMFVYLPDNDSFIFKFVDNIDIKQIRILSTQFNTFDIVYNDTFNIDFDVVSIINPDRNSDVYQDIMRNGYPINYKRDRDFIVFGASAYMNDGRNTRISAMTIFNFGI